MYLIPEFFTVLLCTMYVHGTKKDHQKSGKPKTGIAEEQQIEVPQSFVENPHFSVRKASQQIEHRFLGI